jgi:hypothetical protein
MGSEGPRHDPYGFIEVKVVRNGRKVIFHQGLGEWLSVDGVMEEKAKRPRGDLAFESDDEFRVRRFKEATGWDLQMVLRAIEMADNRRPHYDDYPDICAAERRAGWDPNP